MALSLSHRDWPEKTEDWHVETGRSAQSILSGTRRSLNMLCGLPHGSGGRVMIGQTFTLIGRPKLVFRLEARRRRRVRRGRLVDPAIARRVLYPLPVPVGGSREVSGAEASPASIASGASPSTENSRRWLANDLSSIKTDSLVQSVFGSRPR